MTDNDLIAALAREGLYASVIGAKFRLRAAEVVKICKAMQVEVKSKENQFHRKTARIKLLLQSGNYTQKQICELVDCEPVNVRQVRHQLGMVQDYPHREEIRKKYRKKAHLAAGLVRAGMTVKEACSANRISTATYHRYVVSDL